MPGPPAGLGSSNIAGRWPGPGPEGQASPGCAPRPLRWSTSVVWGTSCLGEPVSSSETHVLGWFSGSAAQAFGTQAGSLTSKSHHWSQLEGQRDPVVNVHHNRAHTASARPWQPSARHSLGRAWAPGRPHAPQHAPLLGPRGRGEGCCPPQPGCGDPRRLARLHSLCVSR